MKTLQQGTTERLWSKSKGIILERKLRSNLWSGHMWRRSIKCSWAKMGRWILCEGKALWLLHHCMHILSMHCSCSSSTIARCTWNPTLWTSTYKHCWAASRSWIGSRHSTSRREKIGSSTRYTYRRGWCSSSNYGCTSLCTRQSKCLPRLHKKQGYNELRQNE